ncbi:hypothetical protein SAMN04488503_2860 [Humidesulfovibrio mexicanus]|uniref:DUF554 domain-containing protein n=1 Tax=Humidesulfovibrio mexicanus TaxID=147047 RepID=A0A239BX79_9BACT|nr:DUF554 domain-containing protein [Humidesulfovibrio mexicanus]SNS12617.1 hypothetical protein SAMN04488503_2860 [Humidesulfovibrio mexicanus]
MTLPVGSLVNAAAIILGSLAGMALHGRFPERFRSIVFQGLGLCVLLIGAKMALTVSNPLLLIFAILLGGLAGELLRLDMAFERLGERAKALLRSGNPQFTEGLITASLIFCIGAMAIVGSFDEGIRGDATVLYTKSILDGFASVALASTFGSGVLFSFVPVLLYQGALTLFAGLFQQHFTPTVISQLTATGGLLILGIGLTLLDIKRVNLSNLLPSLLVAVLLALFFA